MFPFLHETQVCQIQLLKDLHGTQGQSNCAKCNASQGCNTLIGIWFNAFETKCNACSEIHF